MFVVDGIVPVHEDRSKAKTASGAINVTKNLTEYDSLILSISFNRLLGHTQNLSQLLDCGWTPYALQSFYSGGVEAHDQVP